MSNERFAAHLGISARAVAGWHQKPAIVPKSEVQQMLDTALDRAPKAAQERYAELSGGAPATGQSALEPMSDAERRLIEDPHIAAALGWLDDRAGREPGTSRCDVAARLSTVDLRVLHDRGARRGRVSRPEIVDALQRYYGGDDLPEPYGWFAGRYADLRVATSVLTCPDWLDLECPLIGPSDRLRPGSASLRSPLLDASAAGRAAQRLAESLASGTKIFNNPIYQLVQLAVHKGMIEGTLRVTHFVEYALTTDLLESELVDAVAAGETVLSLRYRYLPDLPSVLRVGDRLCAGGALALCAIARPEDPYRGEADYVLLVQERSGHVLNAARRLAVIPKGFHQPLTGARSDARIGSTLRRELEEELFGRDDVDSTLAAQRAADPMHPSLLSEPMRWLLAEPGRLRMEGTGFGLNVVSGNYEFAGLIVIEDEEFWIRYGGLIEANWEAAALRQYSTCDGDLIGDLVGDVAWSNEGLFALLQGLRRLKALDTKRVELPDIDWEICR